VVVPSVVVVAVVVAGVVVVSVVVASVVVAPVVVDTVVVPSVVVAAVVVASVVVVLVVVASVVVAPVVVVASVVVASVVVATVVLVVSVVVEGLLEGFLLGTLVGVGVVTITTVVKAKVAGAVSFNCAIPTAFGSSSLISPASIASRVSSLSFLTKDPSAIVSLIVATTLSSNVVEDGDVFSEGHTPGLHSSFRMISNTTFRDVGGDPT
jgi:hypothetical protein